MSPRARRFDVLLSGRAMAARTEIPEVAAALERTSEPNGPTLETVRRLLRDGCTSPLYNPPVAEQRLRAALDRIRVELQSCDPADAATQLGVPLAHVDSRMSQARQPTGALGR